MFKNLIINYIKKMTKEDIILFSQKQNYKLLDEEVDIIYEVIKKDYLKLFIKDQEIFTYLKNNLRIETFNKLNELYDEYNLRYKIN